MNTAARKNACGSSCTSGYILFETMIALAVLSVGIFAIHRGMQQALFMRGQARDYTQVRFLIENLVAQLNLQRRHAEGEDSGQFPGEFNRFRYRWKISRVKLPLPPAAANVNPEEAMMLPYPYVALVQVWVSWERNGVAFQEQAQTILTPDRLFVPPAELGQPLGAAS